MSELIWGFRNVCVQDSKTRTLFNVAPQLYGLEAWRAIATDVIKSHDIRYQAARAKMREWPKASRMEDVPGALTAIEVIIKEQDELVNEPVTPVDDRNRAYDLRGCLPSDLITLLPLLSRSSTVQAPWWASPFSRR